MTLHASFQATRFAEYYHSPSKKTGTASKSVSLPTLFGYINPAVGNKAVNEKCAAQSPLASIIAGLDQPHIGGDGDNILVSFTTPAPAGWVLHLHSDHPTIQLPATYTVPQGAYNVFVPFVSEAVDKILDIAISATLNGQTINSPISVYPTSYRKTK